MAAGTAGSGDGSLSLPTLLTAALASGAAAVLVGQFSESGSAMAAALMAIFVPLLREAFHRPARALTEKRSGRRAGSVSMTAAAEAGTGRGAQPGTRETEVVAVSSGLEGATAARPAGTRWPADEAQTSATPSGHGHERDSADEASLFGEPAGMPGDMLAREGETGEEGRLPDDDPTRRLDAGDAHAEEATRPIDAESPSPELETRRLEGDAAGPEAETRALTSGASTGAFAAGAPTAARPPARGDGADGAAGARRYGSRAAVTRRALAGRRARVRVAIVTGLLAFLIAAVAITVPELITGGSIAGGEGRTTLFSGGGDGSSDSGSDDAIEDGAIDGDGGSSSDSGDGGSSEPVPGGGGASEDDGDTGGSGDAGSGTGAGGGTTGEGGGAGEGSGSSAPAPESAAPSGGGAPAP